MLSAAQLKAGQKGIVTHALCSQAFGGQPLGARRQCPTDQLLAWTNEYAQQL